MIVRRASLWIAIAGIILTIATLWGAGEQPPSPPPLGLPPQNPYRQTVAAAGIVEAVNENVRLAPPVSGLITRVDVVIGDRVQQGDPLCQLDSRELMAQLQTREEALLSATAHVAEQTIKLKDLFEQVGRLKAVRDQRAVSQDELKRKWYEMKAAKHALEWVRAELRFAYSQRGETLALLDRLTIRAPRDATVLQVNIRAGEYALAGAVEPLMILGDTNSLQVRADVDEVNAPLVRPGSPAVAYLKGFTDEPIPLQFARVEPFIVPKRSLTGENTERVDTRVLQVIYHFALPPFPVYVGQQVDVFIQRDTMADKDAPFRGSVAGHEGKE